MTRQEIKSTLKNMSGLDGMTVNEALYKCDLLDEFEKSLKTDKSKARFILELLNVDKTSIDKIVK